MNLVTNKCRLCSGEIVQVIDFGKMPIANGFLKLGVPLNFGKELRNYLISPKKIYV